MLTLSDINELTNSKDGDIYSDLHKDVYGSRPRYAQFESIEEFDKDFEFLVNRLNEQNAQEKIEDPQTPLNQIKILPFKEKNEWNLVTKYNIGRKK